MPNHIHSNESASDESAFIQFHSRLESIFARKYNNYHHRNGPVFQQQFGYAPKTVAKKLRDNISYIANNPVVGGLADQVLDYRWNLLAYYSNKYPYSSNVDSAPLRRAKSLVKSRSFQSLPLDYALLERLYCSLNNKEKQCLTDFIVSNYNMIDYGSLLPYYHDDYGQMIIALNANSGSEYDIPEDYHNYSNYRKMIHEMLVLGVDLKQCNFEKIDPGKINYLIGRFSEMGIPTGQIGKFLHLTGKLGV